MKIKQADFLISNTNPAKCPSPNFPEYAFIGRSNVGKSSLINMLTLRNKLAKISSQPGKTQLINHFIINNKWYLVDLPGYGYAKSSKVQRNKWNKFIQEYLFERKNLICTFVLIDSRIEIQNNDLEFMTKLIIGATPFAIVFTKTDKLSKSKLDKNINAYKLKLLQEWESLPPIFVSSAIKKVGREEILNYIDELNFSDHAKSLKSNNAI